MKVHFTEKIRPELAGPASKSGNLASGVHPRKVHMCKYMYSCKTGLAGATN